MGYVSRVFFLFIFFRKTHILKAAWVESVCSYVASKRCVKGLQLYSLLKYLKAADFISSSWICMKVTKSLFVIFPPHLATYGEAEEDCKAASQAEAISEQ